MRIAFYAPLKAPNHPTPSGDRRVARLLMDALHLAGHTVDLASEFRSFDREGDAQHQRALAGQGRSIAQALIEQWHDVDAPGRPDLWFTYHLYYKAPDWLGPAVCRALDLPYVVAEASHAAKRASGPWAIGHAAAEQALRSADLLLSPTGFDVAGLQQLVTDPERIRRLPPFVDPVPYQRAARKRGLWRLRLGRLLGLPMSEPWLVVAAMMRHGDKLASYCVLADTLPLLQDLPWQLLVCGDGDARGEVEALLGPVAAGRVHFLGACDARAMAAVYAAGDICLWPAVNEAYGMAMLEAQAAGLPVVSCATRGVPDVVQHGQTGLLASEIDARALAACVRELLTDPPRRRAMGVAAAQFVAQSRSLSQAARTLASALAPLLRLQRQAPAASVSTR
ncbi:MAG TPA: glycosyltransferase family 4 protein [Burkholderiaceae bacterium]|nr:glycosyltransferase family 4 protein [Burkholderiaceae bacterium]